MTPYLIDTLFLPVLVQLEQTGCYFDPTGLEETREELEATRDANALAVEAIAGWPVNLNKPADKAKLLDQLGLPPVKINKKSGIRSTDKETLAALAELHPVVGCMQEWQKASKLLQFVDKMPKVADHFGGRIKYALNNTIVETGRLSAGSKKLGPFSLNVQQIPARTEMGKRLRRHFAAPPGHDLYAVDASQFQLRIAAVDSGDPAMIAGFHSGLDYHDATAIDMFGETSKAFRYCAKTINFAILFGATKDKILRTIASQLGAEAAKDPRILGAYDLYRQTRPRLIARIAEVQSFLLHHGYVQDYFGRRNYYDVSGPKWAVEKVLREGYNMKIQGPEASIMPKLAGAMILRWCSLTGARDVLAVLTVHDEIVFQVPQHQAAAFEEAVTLAEAELNDLLGWPVPVVFNAEHGPNWAEAH